MLTVCVYFISTEIIGTVKCKTLCVVHKQQPHVMVSIGMSM